MFNNGTTLKWYSRLKVYKNSPDSCSFDPQNNIGYSYAEKIIRTVDDENGNTYKVFNESKFSVTTTNHQSTLWGFYREMSFDGIVVYLNSINYISDIQGLINASFEQINNDNTNLIERFDVTNLDDYKNKRAQYILDQKENGRLNRIVNKLRKYDYSEKNIVNKYNEVIKNNSVWFNSSIYNNDFTKIVTLLDADINGLLDVKFNTKLKYNGSNLHIAEKLNEYNEKGYSIQIDSDLMLEITNKKNLTPIFNA